MKRRHSLRSTFRSGSWALILGVFLLAIGPMVGRWDGVEAAAQPAVAPRGADAAGQPKSVERILQRAFDNLYGYDMQMILTLELHTGHGEVAIRRSEVARKRIHGLTHSFAHFLSPSWMRGTRMLLIDNTDRSDDVFLFLPENGRVRRLTTVRRSDYFLGSDFWYEDLERRNVSDYRILSEPASAEGDTGLYRIDAEPVFGASAYARVRFEIDRSDLLMARVSFYRQGSESPFREIEFDRDHVIERDGYRIPTRLVVKNHLRKSETVALFEDLKVNPKLDDALFRSTALLTRRRIPGLTDGADFDD